MKEYQTEKIRNIAFVGHQGSGKTTTTEAMLFVSGQIKQKGDIDKKTTISDFLVEEQLKQASLSTSLIPVEYNGYKLNILDTPGTDELIGDLVQSLSVVKSAVILVDATKGVEVGTERVWKEIRNRHIPGLIFVNRIDKENINFDKLLTNIREKLGKAAIPFAIPIGKQEKFDGFINIIEQRAYVFDEQGNMKEAEIYPDKLDKVNELHSQILDTVATTSEKLLDKYLAGEEISREELSVGLKEAVINGDIIPVLVGSSIKNVGIKTLLDMLIDFMPGTQDLKPMKGFDKENKEISRKTEDNIPLSGYVFKSLVDPFLGVINLVKIISGTLTIGQEILVANTAEVKKINAISTLMGKNQIEVAKFHAGDICALTKLDLETGQTICDPKSFITFPKIQTPTPVLYIALIPKNKQDEDKISGALQKLNIEDPSFEIKRNKETNQLLIGGQGMTHLGFIIDRMKSMFKVDVDVADQKIVYRETIKKQVEAEGKHKKQSGGAGQYGHVWIRFIPTPNQDFKFEEEIFGGAVPKNYFPAVEKGLIETFERGPLAKFPVIFVKAVLYDGSYHPVDSNEISFKLAASLAFKKACETAQPTILEPIMKVDITVNDSFVGDVMGDINKRRGRLLGMDQGEGYQIIHAEVPEAEIIKYAIDLKAMTQGSGTFSREFVRYEEVPHQLIDKIVKEYNK